MPRASRVVCPGDSFGHFTVIREVDKVRYTGVTMRQFDVKCSCDQVRTVTLNNLVSGRSTNCGCKRSYYRRQRGDSTRPGARATPPEPQSP